MIIQFSRARNGATVSDVGRQENENQVGHV
jgi:hypothetical protein